MEYLKEKNALNAVQEVGGYKALCKRVRDYKKPSPTPKKTIIRKIVKESATQKDIDEGLKKIKEFLEKAG